MQPLVSPVDHEARSHHYDDDDDSPPTEYTPLLHSDYPRRSSNCTIIFVSLLIVFLLFGIVISVLLFIEQDKQWPINLPFEMVTRSEWGANPPKYQYKNITTRPVGQVILTHTGTAPCDSVNQCKIAVRAMQSSYQNLTLNWTDLPFNYLISSSGITFEGRGWDRCGEVDPENDCTSLSVAAIGNYIEDVCPLSVAEEFKAFLDEGIWRKRIAPNYRIIGRPFNGSPENLFKLVRSWKHWSYD